MYEKMNLLRELQEVDQELAELATARAGFEGELQGLSDEKIRVQGMVDELQSQLDELQGEEAQFRREQVAEKDQIIKVESRLPDIQTQKEYVAVLKEIDMAKKASLETQAKIAAKDKEIAELQADFDEKQTELTAISEKCAARQAEVDSLLQESDKKYSARQSTRDSLAKDLPKSLLSKYQRIFTRRGGLAVARVIEGACLGCNMQLPPQQYNRLQRGTELQSCPHCNRLLYMDRD
ncbi:zinc ribbon domain-containing protein [Geopsychrobacter electrodiphilus]|uniref:zinc ribbon domain-containing protein n=1 Tax=Geopsychrobacter electrodiphilus TaxID=225196 RepID=UPI0003788D7D|nr:C4-type zinc ribbon domain-containing protein [Geopsychrobacter electrodiphilus]